jgi:outer membrane lipoprotein SlyB
MKRSYCLLCLICMLTVWMAIIGCARDRYNTQRGAVTGAALGAAYGQAIGRDTESTLLGTALGGLAGAVIGNYEDQRLQQRRDYRVPTNTVPSEGRWITVPSQYVGNQYVPSHQVWLSSGQQRQGVVVERR